MIGRASLGCNAGGKRQVGTVSAKTKTEAQNKLRALLRDHDDGLPTQRPYTVSDAVETWLVHGLVGRDPNTVTNRTSLARTHIIPGLGKRRLAELTAEEVDRWLAHKATTLSTDTLQRLLSILRQSFRRAQARDVVKRNSFVSLLSSSGMPIEDIAHLVGHANTLVTELVYRREPAFRSFEAGDFVTCQGQPGGEVFLLLNGILGVEIDDRQIAQVGPGAIVGERALLEEGVRTASLRALTRCHVAVAQRDQLDPAKLGELSEDHRRELHS